MIFDAVIVPGGGVQDDGRLTEWAASRFDRALQLQPGGPFLALSGGTPHKPAQVIEAYAGAKYLLSLGVASECIYTEISSYDTIGNAFFARVQHCDVRRWRRLLVVTSRFHLPRTEAIFRWLFALAPISGYDLTFEASADDGMPSELLTARLEREAASLEAFQDKADRFHSLAEVHAWLYADHGAYRAESVVTPRPVDPLLARLY